MPDTVSFGDQLTAALREGLDREYEDSGKTVAQALAEVMFSEALKGNYLFMREIFDRIDGPVNRTKDGSVIEHAGVLLAV